MLITHEDQIRDALAENLSVFGETMTVIGKEYYLENSLGGRGFIDILAKDIYGNYVVIEIKRTGQAAKEAIHELCKYVALLQIMKGVPFSKIRCIIASIEWWDLLVPFSEYSRISPHPVEGYRIIVNPDNIGCEKIRPVEPRPSLTICRSHMAALYETEVAQSSGIAVIERSIKNSVHEDFVVCSLNYGGNNDNVIYKNANYVIQRSLTENENKAIAAKNGVKYNRNHANEGEFYEDYIWERFSYGDISELEIGYPEKFMSMITELGWKIQSVNRYGKFKSNPMTDQEIIEEILGQTGMNSSYFYSISNPKFKLSFNNTLKDMNYPLIGNEIWGKAIKKSWSHIAKKYKGAIVSVKIFNPSDILMQLFAASTKGGVEARWLPSCEVVVEGSEPKNRELGFGILRWSGVTPNLSPQDVIAKNFGNIEKYFLMRSFGETCSVEDNVANGLGLYYDFISVRDGEPPRSMVDGSIISPPFFTVNDFVRENKHWLQNLEHHFRMNMCEM